MNSVSVRPALIVKSPIRAWRIVGGAFLHFAVPVYVVTVAVATLFAASGAPRSTSLPVWRWVIVVGSWRVTRR